MFLKNIKIRNFRNLEKIDLEFETGISYFYSPNGSGKTNLLEAIQCITVGKSFRSKSESDIFSLNESKTVLISGNFQDEDEIQYQNNYILEKEPKKRKELQINKNKVNINYFIGRSPSIWFSPESIKIINSSPLNKRKYFDDILIQLYPEYYHNLRNYNRALKQRNRVLQNQNLDKSSIKVWTEELIEFGGKIIKQRQYFFEKLNEEFSNLKNIERYEFKILPQPSVKLDNVFNESAEFKFLNELQKCYYKDLNFQTTTIGPHKDSWEMLIKIKPNKEFIAADRFASRGQQRMSLIFLQIVLINLFIKSKNIFPIMLLDDIFSELDTENEKILLDFLNQNKIQTFITGVERIKDDKIKQIEMKYLIINIK